MTGHQRENPALDPTRLWEESPEVEMELTLLVGGIRKRARERWGTDLAQFLTALLDSGAAAVGGEDEQVVDFVNANATAFGFLPLIERHGETCSVTSGAHQPLRRALERIIRSTG